MIKTIKSLLLVVAVVFGTMLTTNAQEDKSYAMWELIMLTPDNTKLKVLSENMRKHNQTYHKEGPYDANVFTISSGPNAGKILWIMGPMNYKHNDSRPSAGGHDVDWRDNVMMYIKKMHTIEYWRQGKKLSNTDMLDGDPSKYPLLFVRYAEVADGQNSSVRGFFKTVSETIKAMEGVNPWGIFYNEFRQGDLGRHIATVGYYKNWTQFDEEENNFKETFLKAHSENDWDAFTDAGDRAFSNTWDEIWEFNAAMSGK